MFKAYAFVLFFCALSHLTWAQITPYQYTDAEAQKGLSPYTVPAECKFSAPPLEEGPPKVNFYLSKPTSAHTYPLVLLCGGSSSRKDIQSAIHLHRYFLQQLLDLRCGVITVEQQGVSDTHVDPTEFMNHYTRSRRLSDCKAVIEHLRKHPPIGWNGKFVFIGVSEGGPLVTQLTADYQLNTLATINWCGADGLNWKEELWLFIDSMRDILVGSLPWYHKLRLKLPSWAPFALQLPTTRQDYEQIIYAITQNPTYSKEFMGMTYAYHVDALNWPLTDLPKIKTPFLVVGGAKDPAITSIDTFVRNAEKAGMPITYFRIEDMGHSVRKRPDVLERSFKWLKHVLSENHPLS